MLALTLLALLSSTDGKVAIVERTTLGIPAGSGVALRQRLRMALGAAGLEAELVSPACADRDCLTALARSRGACVVGVTLVKNKKGLTVDLEAVDAAAVVLQQTFLLANDQLERSPEAQVFAYQLGTRLAKDRPVVESLPPPKVLTPGLVEVGRRVGDHYDEQERQATAAASLAEGFGGGMSDSDDDGALCGGDQRVLS